MNLSMFTPHVYHLTQRTATHRASLNHNFTCDSKIQTLAYQLQLCCSQLERDTNIYRWNLAKRYVWLHNLKNNEKVG